MSLELRPTWCLDDSAVRAALSLGEWLDTSRHSAFDRDGDDWSPGTGFEVRRSVNPAVDHIDLRRILRLPTGAELAVAARWTCRSSSMSGTHLGGPTPLPVENDLVLRVDIPATASGSVELETCLLLQWKTVPTIEGCPDGTLVWSDSWSTSPRERTILLEGSEARIPVRSISFGNRFDTTPSALWAIDLDTSIELDDLLSNTITILLNDDVLRREFKDTDGEPDASRLPSSVLAAIQVDLLESLTATLSEELHEAEGWEQYPDGSVGSMLVLRLTEAFGSTEAAAADLQHDRARFSRKLWNRFAPDSWRGN